MMPTMPVAALAIQHAESLLRDCLVEGSVRPSGHFLAELKLEGLIWPDAWHVLRTGVIYNPPEHNVKTGDWTYNIEGHEPDGKWLVIVFCFKTVDRVLLITTFSVGGKTRQP
jgi:hypothetical protein